MAGVADNVKMGACQVSFGAADLGYTSGGVEVSYKADTQEKTVDQEGAPVGEVVVKQSFEVKVPLAEYDLTRFAELLPGAQIVTDATDPTKTKLVLPGSAGVDLLDMAKELTLAPMGGTAKDAITVHHAIPKPELEFGFNKEKQRVYTITFKAMKGESGFVTFGDKTATA
jgi:hypothetical protein